MQPTFADRLRAAIPSVLLTALIGWALVAGLAIGSARSSDDAVKLFQVVPPEPTALVVPEPQRSRRRAGTAAPRNIRSRATEIVAPDPIVRLPVPTPVIAAPVAGAGQQASSGATLLPGSGTGAGGEGDGFGAGGDGDGDGGGDDGDYTPPRPRSGSLRMSDYPLDAETDLVRRSVSVRYFVQPDGRVTGCRVTRSSGNAELDMTTCRLIEKRFRYYPSRDPDGRPVRAIVVGDHTWEAVPDGPEDR